MKGLETDGIDDGASILNRSFWKQPIIKNLHTISFREVVPARRFHCNYNELIMNMSYSLHLSNLKKIQVLCDAIDLVDFFFYFTPALYKKLESIEISTQYIMSDWSTEANTSVKDLYQSIKQSYPHLKIKLTINGFTMLEQ